MAHMIRGGPIALNSKCLPASGQIRGGQTWARYLEDKCAIVHAKLLRCGDELLPSDQGTCIISKKKTDHGTCHRPSEQTASLSRTAEQARPFATTNAKLYAWPTARAGPIILRAHGQEKIIAR